LVSLHCFYFLDVAKNRTPPQTMRRPFFLDEEVIEVTRVCGRWYWDTTRRRSGVGGDDELEWCLGTPYNPGWNCCVQCGKAMAAMKDAEVWYVVVERREHRCDACHPSTSTVTLSHYYTVLMPAGFNEKVVQIDGHPNWPDLNVKTRVRVNNIARGLVRRNGETKRFIDSLWLFLYHGVGDRPTADYSAVITSVL
jgi:hypothetical protein